MIYSLVPIRKQRIYSYIKLVRQQHRPQTFLFTKYATVPKCKMVAVYIWSEIYRDSLCISLQVELQTSLHHTTANAKEDKQKDVCRIFVICPLPSYNENKIKK